MLTSYMTFLYRKQFFLLPPVTKIDEMDHLQSHRIIPVQQLDEVDPVFVM